MTFFKFYLFILRERERVRERACVSRGGAKRDGERERNPSRLCTVSRDPDAGLKLMNTEIMT